MAARLHHFLLLAALLLLIGRGAPSSAGAAGNGKVPVELYYESLCPSSAQFVTDRLAEALEDGLLEAADVTLVPYGNAKVGKGGTITCEHGPEECLLNTVEACAIDAWPDVVIHLHLIVVSPHGCIANQSVTLFAPLQLSLKYGKQTGALVPPLNGVPHVVVDGKPREDREFVSYVCKAYKGRPPKICHEPDRHCPTVVEAGNGVSYNPADFKLEDGVEVPRTDDN
ncbi:gamma-interferon-responsive lysosomal thiol protein-like [Triticum dicoccoides]|uniref:gamma-interferon-responsive lysosomal thiol protein-like n=1 Tax=Triticum dicoccoides TaxID=85692 RepID=UPI00188E176E|nr:gamma-interferon-responsive lysosomal thiol protein-like [Triticum dicoccoides]